MAAQLVTSRDGILAVARDPDALDGAQFADGVLAAVGRSVGFDGYCLFGVDPVSGLRSVMFAGHGLSASTERLVHNETVEHDVNRYVELARADRPSGVLAPRGFASPRSPRLHDILRPDGYGSELRLALVSGGRYWGALNLFRAQGQARFDDTDADVAAQLGEALSLALRRFQVRRQEHHSSSRPDGVVLFGGQHHILSVSHEAREWLGELSTKGTGVNDVIRVVHEAAAQPTGATGATVGCCVRTDAGGWLVVSRSVLAEGEATVAVVLRAGDVRRVAPAVAQLCGLSGRETEVLRLVLDGLPAKQMARRLSLSVLTVNDHLASVYRKAGVRGREELLALIC